MPCLLIGRTQNGGGCQPGVLIPAVVMALLTGAYAVADRIGGVAAAPSCGWPLGGAASAADLWSCG